MRYRRGKFDCDQSKIKGTLLGSFVPFRLYLDGCIRTTAQMLKSDTTFGFSKDSTVSAGSNTLRSVVHSPTKARL